MDGRTDGRTTQKQYAHPTSLKLGVKKLEMCPQYTDAPAPTPSAAQGHDPGATVPYIKSLDVGKCHAKFQLSSSEGIKVISCKRNVDVNLHLNLQVNLNLVTNVTYAHTHVRT